MVLNNEYLLPRRFDNDNVYTYNQFDYAHIASGIYVIAGDRNLARVYTNPIGDLSLMEDHMDRILSTIDSTPANWTTRLNSLRQATTSDEAVEMEALKKNAKRLQTPGKSVSGSNLSSFKDANAFSELLDGEEWDANLRRCGRS